MKPGSLGSFGAQLKTLREAAGFTQEELATIAGLSVHGVSALERGERRRPHVETVRALDKSLDDLKELAEREVHTRLGPDRWARAYAAGRVSSIEALLKDIEGRPTEMAPAN